MGKIFNFIRKENFDIVLSNLNKDKNYKNINNVNSKGIKGDTHKEFILNKGNNKLKLNRGINIVYVNLKPISHNNIFNKNSNKNNLRNNINKNHIIIDDNNIENKKEKTEKIISEEIKKNIENNTKEIVNNTKNKIEEQKKEEIKPKKNIKSHSQLFLNYTIKFKYYN